VSRRFIYIPFSDRAIPFESWWAIAAALVLEAVSYRQTRGVGTNHPNHAIGLFAGMAVGWWLRYIGAVPTQEMQPAATIPQEPDSGLKAQPDVGDGKA
jgi:hypothetical protein